MSTILQLFEALSTEFIILEFKDFLISELEWISLMNSCKSFHELKIRTISIHLKEIDGKRFYFNESFRNRVLSKLYKPELQMSLTLDAFCDKDWRSFWKEQKESFWQKLSFPTYNRNRNPDIPTEAIDISWVIPMAYDLRIKGFKEMKGFETLLDLPDKLILKSMYLTTSPSLISLNYFSRIQNLTLDNLSSITDVSCLSKIPHLSITRCENIDNINSLTQNRVLIIKSCQNIVSIEQIFDPSDLQERQIMNIFGCDSLERVILMSKQSVKSGTTTTTTSPFKIRSLELDCCPRLELFHVYSPTTWCPDLSLQDFIGELFISHLTIINCPALLNINGFSNMPIESVTYRENDNTSSTQFSQFFPCVQEITIGICARIDVISNFLMLTKLTLIWFEYNLEEISNCPLLVEIYIDELCYFVRRFSDLPSLTKIMFYCELPPDLEAIEIIRCPLFKQFELFEEKEKSINPSQPGKEVKTPSICSHSIVMFLVNYLVGMIPLAGLIYLLRDTDKSNVP